ncbi:MAG: riboflavin synthase [Chitinophagales bacterium]|nr:riboflavin synthase [Chitinophagales bacterium]
MFTGIIETAGKVIDLKEEGSNKRFTIGSSISAELKIDESISHDGVCLTIVGVKGNQHEVIAVEETLQRSIIGNWNIKTEINIERALLANQRLDGHIVQGHVDDVAVCKKIENKNGSWIFTFRYNQKYAAMLVDKGSVCINGVSLTVIKPSKKKFSVAIIPYTYEHTTLHSLKENDQVNIEFDIIGKYAARWMETRRK